MKRNEKRLVKSGMTESLDEEAYPERKVLTDFSAWLKEEEKAPATQEKYMREAKRFLEFLSKEDSSMSKNRRKQRRSPQVTQSSVIDYKNTLLQKGYTSSGINAMLAGVRAFLTFLGRTDIRVKNLRVQRRPYIPENRMLEREEYLKIIRVAKAEEDRVHKEHEAMHDEGHEKAPTSLILETLCATGVRISELKHFTAEAVQTGEIVIRLKGKERIILIPEKLKKKLMTYSLSIGVSAGPIFLNRKGAPVHRSSIWARMKQAAVKANVPLSKVTPHNLRKLFARTFYNEAHDIAGLADILGHSSVDTTRIYIRTSEREQRKYLDGLKLTL